MKKTRIDCVIRTMAMVLLGSAACIADGLPEGYVQMPYVMASGQCRVKTGLTPSGTDKAELTFELTTVSGNQNLWCSRAGETGYFASFMIADKVRFDSNTNQVTSADSLATSTKYTVTADYACGTGTVANVESGTTVTTVDMGVEEFTPASELCLFASHTDDTDTGLGDYGSWIFYSFTLSDAEGTARCNLVPAWRAADGALGLYDLVSSTFLTNDLDGAFTLRDGYSVDENGTIVVAVTAEAQNGGTVRVGDGAAGATAVANVNEDGTESATFTAVPNDGYKFFKWTLDDGAVLTDGALTDTNISVSATQPVTITAVFYSSSDVYAKLVNGVFRYYLDVGCSDDSELLGEKAPASITGCNVVFSSDADYQALVPYTNELATAYSVLLQNDVTLTADADWSAFDFNMNGKVVTLKGYDLKVHRPMNGRFSAGNLINPLSASGNGSSTWSAGSGWWNIGTKSYKNALWWNFTPPKTRNVYINCKTKRYNANYSQYIYFSVGGTVLMNYTRTDNGGNVWRGPWSKALTGGQSAQVMVRRNNGYSMIGFVTISPESHLIFDVPEGEEVDTSSLAFGGASADTYEGNYALGLQIYKTGKGKLLLNKTWTIASNAASGCDSTPIVTTLFVQEGVAKHSGATKAVGAAYSQIVVEEGAQFDLDGRTFHDYTYKIAGSGPDGTGALTSSRELTESEAYVQNKNQAFLNDVSLSSNATVYAAGNMGMIFYNYQANTMTMNGHTVTYDGVADSDPNSNGRAYRIFLGNMSYSGEGKIVVATNGWVQGHISTPSAADCDVEIYGCYWQDTGRLSPVKSLTFFEGSLFRELNTSPLPIVVYSSYGPNEDNESTGVCVSHPTVQLGDADHLETTLDLSHLTEVFDDSEEGTLTIFSPESGTHVVTVEVGDRDEGMLSYLYKWKTAPTNVQFVRSQRMEERHIKIEVRADGVAISTGTTFILR